MSRSFAGAAIMMLLGLPILTFTLIPLSPAVADQRRQTGNVQAIEACRVDLTELARHADFRYSLEFSVLTDAAGHVLKVEPKSQVNEAAQFVRIDQFRSCVQRWLLYPFSEYKVIFTVGTTGDALDHWSIVVSKDGADPITLILPRSERR